MEWFKNDSDLILIEFTHFFAKSVAYFELYKWNIAEQGSRFRLHQYKVELGVWQVTV